MNLSSTLSFADKAAITGVGQTDFVKGTERTAVEMMLTASRRAIADAGLKPSDIDGMVPAPIYPTSEEMAANLGRESVVKGQRGSVSVAWGDSGLQKKKRYTERNKNSPR